MEEIINDSGLNFYQNTVEPLYKGHPDGGLSKEVACHERYNKHDL